MSQPKPKPRPLRSVATPKQARSEDSLRRLLDAAESLFSERAVSEVSVADIARRARSSVGGFYARFTDKDELLLALHERFVRELEGRFAEVEERLGQDPALSDLLREGLHMQVDVYRARRKLLSAFMGRAAENPRLQKAAIGFRRATVARFTRLLLRHRTEIQHPDPELAAEIAVQLALSFMDQSVTSGKLRVAGEVLPDGRIEEELERAVLAYLGVEIEIR